VNPISTPSTRLARAAGLLYLTVGIFAAFSYDYVGARLVKGVGSVSPSNRAPAADVALGLA
jgi:hypothetical protein